MITISDKDLYYIAGLLEGEGWFTLQNKHYPFIGLKMTDRDVIYKASNLMNIKTLIYFSDRRGLGSNGIMTNKVSYTLQVGGSLAVEWMIKLLPLMGSRRQSRIKEVLTVWSNRPRKWRNTDENLHTLVKSTLLEVVN